MKNKVFSENEIIYIPLGSKHISNPNKKALIEVQKIYVGKDILMNLMINMVDQASF